jgi:hypothetical protein
LNTEQVRKKQRTNGTAPNSTSEPEENKEEKNEGAGSEGSEARKVDNAAAALLALCPAASPHVPATAAPETAAPVSTAPAKIQFHGSSPVQQTDGHYAVLYPTYDMCNVLQVGEDKISGSNPFMFLTDGHLNRFDYCTFCCTQCFRIEKASQRTSAHGLPVGDLAGAFVVSLLIGQGFSICRRHNRTCCQPAFVLELLQIVCAWSSEFLFHILLLLLGVFHQR